MIFLSHTHADKPVVEPIALRLRAIFGEKKVFYDSWSIQPGDGIIQKMNEGLEHPRFVFFFVSSQSLKSKMVGLEWQNALFKSTKGECKIIPVRVDGCAMPPVLLQNLYIDMFAHGVEAAIVQIVNVVQGNSTFTPQHLGFSNLTYRTEGDAAKEVVIKISASHLMEPNPEFLVLIENSNNEVSIKLNGGEPHRSGFNEKIRLDNGRTYNGFVVAPLGGAITPQRPMMLTLTATAENPIRMAGLLHRKTHERFEEVPVQV